MFSENDYDDYFLWLCSLVDADMNRYGELLWRLHDMDFSWILDRDDGRAEDGLALRKEYVEITYDDWVELWERPCTVLEALIGLAIRMDDILISDDVSNRVRIWFWEFISNLGLKRYVNANLQYDSDFYDVQRIIDRWLSRSFDFDGYGSPFPLSESYKDQRKETMIYQMNFYITDHELD